MLQIDSNIQKQKTGQIHKNLILSGQVEHTGAKSNKKDRIVRQNEEQSGRVEKPLHKSNKTFLDDLQLIVNLISHLPMNDSSQCI